MNWRAPTLHAGVVGLCNAAVQLASSLGVHLSPYQDEAITGFMNAALILLSAVIISSTNGNGKPG